MNFRYKIKSELSENQIEAEVASYLGYITPHWSSRYRLIAVDEQVTGADKLFDRFVPIYLQFKVSEGLNPSAIIPSRFLGKSLPNIIRYRRRNNLAVNPTLYFPLRKKAKTAFDFQHNILKSFHNPPNQYALYVAPLTLSNKDYVQMINSSGPNVLGLIPPFSYRYSGLYDSFSNRTQMLGMIPFLNGHISIPPHVQTTSDKHHYSFSASGWNVVWHGGEVYPGNYKFSSMLNRIFEESYSRDYGYSLETYYKQIEPISKELGLFELINQNETPLDRIIRFSRGLYSQYYIKMFVLSLKDK